MKQNQPLRSATLEQYPRLRSTRLFEMLKARGYAGNVHAVRRHVRKVRPQPKREVFFRLETLRSEHAQVDWAHFGKVRVGNARSICVSSHPQPNLLELIEATLSNGPWKAHAPAVASRGETFPSSAPVSAMSVITVSSP